MNREFAGRPRLATLATVDVAGAPRARTVVCRRLDEDGMAWITSDARSEKNSQLREDARAELVFWLPEARRQARLAGSVVIFDAADATGNRAGLWRELSNATRATFLWPAPGAQKAIDDSSGAGSAAKRLPTPESLPADAAPPKAFEVLVLVPTRVDLLDLNPRPHARRVWRKTAGGWVERAINP